MDTTRTQDRVRETAYQLWEKDGKPIGKDLHYWLHAEALVAALPDEQPSPEASEPVAEIAPPAKMSAKPRKPKTTKSKP